MSPLGARPLGYCGRHRRKSRTRGFRLALAPWLVISLVAGLLLSGTAVAYAWLLQTGCDGTPTQLSVVVSPDHFTVVDALAEDWHRKKPDVNGHCVAVTVAQRSSAEVAQGLKPQWDTRRDGPRPDVWIPDSTAWVRLAASRAEASAFFGDEDAEPARLAASPVVLAIPEPMAQALGYPDNPVGWRSLASRIAADPTWGQTGHPEWGQLRLGLTDPRIATAGLHMLLALSAPLNGANADSAAAMSFEQYTTVYRAGPEGFLTELADRPSGTDIRDVVIFPALERDIALFNASNPPISLVGIHPDEAPVVADYPFVVLEAPWVSTIKKQIAEKFIRYLTSERGQSAYRENSFHTADESREPLRLAPSHVDQVLKTWVAQRSAVSYEQ